MKKKKAHQYAALPLILISVIFFITNPSAAEVLNDSHILSPESFGFWAYFVLAVAIAPVLEETLFRLWLKPRYAWAIVLPFALAAFQFGKPWVSAVFIPLLVVAAVLFRKRLGAEISARQGIYIWISALLFAAFHLVNFTSMHLAHFFLLLGFTGLALIFANIRLKKGLGYSILAHATYNCVLFLLMMPPLFNQTAQFGEAGEIYLVKRGLFDKDGTVLAEEKSVRCSDCTTDRVIYALFRDYDPNSVTTIGTHFLNPFFRYDLMIEDASQPPAFGTIQRILDESFGLSAEEKTEILPVYRMNFNLVDGHESTVENILARTKTKGETEQVVTMGGGLTTLLQRHYAVRVICNSGCELPLVYVFDEALDIDQNLNNLRDLGLLDYELRADSVRVIRVDVAGE